MHATGSFKPFNFSMKSVGDSLPEVPLSSVSSSSKGYLAFPAGFSLAPGDRLKALEKQLEDRKKEELRTGSVSEQPSKSQSSSTKLDSAWREREMRERDRRLERETREREEALKGEKDWVRSGGVLRDADGRRDYRRTEEVRLIVEEEERQRRAMERWNAYEDSWTRLASSSEELSFKDIPWPLVQSPENATDLREEAAIAKFLFETIGVFGNKATKKDRLRTSLLRWHPDKLGGLLSRVREGDVDAVKDGIDGVVISLMKLQDLEKGERS